MDFPLLLQALAQVRQAVRTLVDAEDLSPLLEVIGTQLQCLHIPFQVLGINLIAPDRAELVAKHLLRQAGSTGWSWERQTQHDPLARKGVIVDFWRAGQVVYRPDLGQEDPYLESGWASRHPGQVVRSVVDVPFSHGTLAVNSSQPRAFSEDHLLILREMAAALSEGFHRQDDLRAFKRQALEAAALSQAILAMSRSQAPEEVFQVVVAGSARVMGCCRARVLLYDTREGILVHRASVGYDPELLSQVRVAPGEGGIGQVFASGGRFAGQEVAEPQANGLFAQAALAPRLAGEDQAAYLPLSLGKEQLGVLAVEGRPSPFDQRDLDLLEHLGEQGVLALERAQHLCQLEEVAAQGQQRVVRELAVQQIREAVWWMRGEEDIDLVLQCMTVELQVLGLDFDRLGVTLIEDRGEEPAVTWGSRRSEQGNGQWLSGSYVPPEDTALRRLIEGLVRIWHHKEMVYRPDLGAGDADLEYEHLRARNPQIRALIDLPFTHGILSLSSTHGQAFDGYLEVLETMALVLSEGFTRANDLKALEDQARARGALARGIATVVGSRNLEEVFDEVVVIAAEMMRATQAAIFLCDPQDQTLAPQAQVGGHRETYRELRVQRGEGVSGQALVTGDSVILSCGMAQPDPALAAGVGAAPWRALEPPVSAGWEVAVPLCEEGRTIGVLTVNGCPHRPAAEDLEHLQTLGHQAVLAIQRQQAFQTLQANEGRYRGLVESLEVIVWEADPATLAFRFVSPQAESMLGYPVTQWLGEEGFWAAHIHPDDRDQALANWRQTVAQGLDRTFSYRMLAADGQLLWIEHKAQVIPAPGGHSPQLMRGTLADITFRKQVEKQILLDLGLQRVRLAIMAMRHPEDWAVVAGRFYEELRQVVGCYRSSIQLVDREREGFTGYFTDGQSVTNHGFHALPASLRQVLSSKTSLYRRTREEIRQYGDLASAEVGCIVDVPFSGGTLGMSSTAEHAFDLEAIGVLESFAAVLSEGYLRLQDLRALEAKELQLRQSQKLEAIGQLTAGIAHNFNNMLQGVVGNLNLAMVDSPPTQQRWLRDAENVAMGAAQMVRQLMLYTRGEAGEFEAGPLELGRVVNDVLSLCRRTFDKSIEIRVTLPSDLPPVQGDGNQLEQVLLNLYMNARDALEEGAGTGFWIQTTARQVKQVAPKEAVVRSYVALQVSDNGPGMEDQVRERIFEPFFTTKEVGKGTGLGLATVYGILQHHQGWIECQSEVGKGTTFTLYLPVAAVSIPAVTGQASAPTIGGSETLLVIDDDPSVRRSMVQLLLHLGYEVLEAAHGLQGLEIAGAHAGHLDLVLLDLSMPGLSGREVLGQLQARDPGLKVIICTGYAADKAEVKGAVAVVRKPVTLRQLATTLRQVLDS